MYQGEVPSHPLAVVVIPTYNEASSIQKLVSHLFEKTFPSISRWKMSVVIVDGNSPDGTADLVRTLKEKYAELHLIVEKKKEGIGAAYFKGFQYSTGTLGADLLIEFDGDFQHPPEAIPLLLEKIESGADLVLGSRQVKGGSFPAQWGVKRLFFSKVGGFVARFILFFPTLSFFKITDPTTGLKATRAGEVYQKLDFDNFISRGFGYKLEMLFYLMRSGAGVSEIPLNFQLRDEGESKIETDTPREILRTVFKLRLNDPATRRFVKFGIVGFLGYLVNALGVEIFAGSRLTQSIADRFSNGSGNLITGIFSQKSSWSAAFATEIAIINNFTWNNLWTFRRRIIRGWILAKKFLHFNLTSIGAILLQFFALGAATLFFGNTRLVRQLALVFAIGFLVVPYNWFMYNVVIWRRSVDLVSGE